MSKTKEWLIQLQEAGQLPTPDDSDYELMEEEHQNYLLTIKKEKDERNNKNTKAIELSAE